MENNNIYKKTIKLYDDNAYETKFEAEILGVEKGAIILDKTVFFPNEGGQSCDKGILKVQDAGLEIAIDNVEIVNGVLYHYYKQDGSVIDNNLVGKLIEGEIYFDERFEKMQQHSAEHIFSGLANKHFGCNNVGFHLSDNGYTTFDYDKPLSDEDLEYLELECNKLIYKNIPIKAYYPTIEELKKLTYRSKKEIDEEVRIVEIVGVDMCACCAPHVANTAEIGICKVVESINYKGGVRITIKCGLKVLEEIKSREESLEEFAKNLETSSKEFGKKLKVFVEESKRNENRLDASNRRLFDLIESILSYYLDDNKNENVCDIDNNGNEGCEISIPFTSFSENVVTNDVIFLEFDEMNNIVLRNLVNRLTNKYPDKYCGICYLSEKGYYYIVSSENKDCKKILEKIKEEFDVKGGGSSKMIQGTFTSNKREDVKEIKDFLRRMKM